MLSTETLSQKFAKKGLWLYIFTFMIAPIGYIVKVMLSHDLSVADIGALYGIISLLGLLNVYSDLGMVESLNYFLPKLAVKEDYKRMKYLLLFTFIVQIVSSVGVSLGVYYGADWIATHYFHNSAISELIQISALFFIGLGLIHFASSIFSALQFVKLQKGIEAIRSIATLIGTAILFIGGTATIVDYMWCWIIGIFIGSFFGILCLIQKVYAPYLDNEILVKDITMRNSFVRYSAGTFLTSNVTTLLSQVDIQLVIYILGTEQAGYYTNYLSLIGIPFIFLGPILGFLFPVISELAGRGDHQKITLLFTTFTTYFSIIAIWVSVVFFCLGEYLSIGFFGEKFRESGMILMYSAPFIIFSILIQLHFQILSGLGKIRQKFMMLLVVLPINIILNLICIVYFDLGARGSALAVGISWIPLYLMSLYYIRDYVSIINKNVIVINVVGSALFGFATYIFVQSLGLISRWECVVVFSVAILLAFCIFVLINFRLLRDFISAFRNGLLSR